MAQINPRKLARMLSFPGIDPRSFVVSGQISKGDNAVRIENDGCMYADIDVSGTDVDHEGEETILPSITAQLVFPTNGVGIVYTGKPSSGTPVVVVIPNGMVDNDVYAICVNSADRKLPKSVINNPNDMHIVAPTGSVIRIGSRNDGNEKRVARVDDEIKITHSTDDAFLSFIESLMTAWNAALGSGSPIMPTGSPIPFTPGSVQVTGKITKGSSRVMAGGQST